MDAQSGAPEKGDSKPLEPVISHEHGSADSIRNLPLAVDTNLRLVDEAIEAIGFGRFQIQLTFTSGFGFLVDQMILVCISLLTPQAAMEFGPQYPTLLSASNYAGLFVGAIILGGFADNLGRRMIWQLSIFAVSVAALLVAAMPNWAGLNVMLALLGFFGGGNRAHFTLLAPMKWGFVLSGLASIWGLGNTLTGLIAWPLLVTFGCESGSTPATCPKEDNMGWRYLYITVGGLCLIMAAVRAFVLSTLESPRWLVSCGRVDEAVNVLNKIATLNKANYAASADDFVRMEVSVTETKSFSENLQRAKRLVTGGKQIWLMTCLALMWMLIGIAYPLYTIFLPYYLASHGASFGESSNYTTYRDWTVSSVVGIFGPFLSMWMVSNKWLRSKKSLFVTAAISAIFSGAFTTVRNDAQNLAFSCMINFWLNALYAIVYSYTPQSLSVENRGLGNGLLMALGRLSSLSAPFIATFGDVSSPVPIFVACGCFVIIGLIGLVLPVDSEPFSY
ncbi:unnamed protein product [Clonostachys rosea]|uniref:Major facilitator superfamily (MFS) profile domain-containing protein n=1 Tax=Bionectria ochroleuca TaxID=29856 RepID=A0ABY6UNX2_BIOOC|nr:unnamed protein product [Clonostachys rosea]